jgi:N-methylhydantoinase A
MYRIAVDVGGTFADFMATGPGGKVLNLKLPADNENPLELINRAMIELAGGFNIPVKELIANLNSFIYGGTTAVNALIEKKGVRTALITTEGFRDALEMRRSKRKEQWDFFAPAPPPLVPRRLRFSLRERMDYRGAPLIPVNRRQLENIACRLDEEGVEAVAVCLLFSFKNPAHEKEVEEYLRDRLPGVFISPSADVSPRIREYERTSTTVLNACLSPLLANSLRAMENFFLERDITGRVWLMQNNGGLTGMGSADNFGVTGLLSGPAGGVRGAQALAELTGHPDLVIVDMGGTSFDVSLVKEYQTQICPESEVEGYHLNLPMLDIRSIGAGGGSIARVDPGGMLKVGPRSAGANPGPACYNRGGEEPTVTDAALLLGLLNPANFLGGRMPLNCHLAYRAVEEKVAGPLGISVEEAALAIFRVAAAMMMDAVHLNTVRRGYNPEDFTLLACGGASPLFAGEITAGLGISKIIIPAHSSVFCAEGMLYAGARYDLSLSYPVDLDNLDPGEFEAVIDDLLARGRAKLVKLKVPEHSQAFRVFLEMKYTDQHHEIPVEYKNRGHNVRSLHEIRKSFDSLHQKLYGYSQPENPCRIVNIRVEAYEDKETIPLLVEEKLNSLSPKPKGERAVCLNWTGKFERLPIYDGEQIVPGHLIRGPAIIEKAFTTIPVRGNEEAVVDYYYNLVITRREDNNGE